MLLVEDSEADAKLVARELGSRHPPLHIERVEEERAMREALLRPLAKWDVVICDWAMPRFSALRALAILHELKLDLPFIIVSGTAGEETAVEAMRAGAHDYVVKQNLARLGPAVDRGLRDAGVREALRDVSERRRSNEERTFLAEIVESSCDAIIGTTVDGIVLSWNLGAERLYDFTREEMLGRSTDILAPRGLEEELPELRRRVMSGARVHQFETVRRKKNGSTVEVALTMSPIRDRHGVVSGLSIIAHDLSERRATEKALRRTEEQLRQAQKIEAIGNLAGGIAHDFNNLLSVILSYSAMLAEDLEPHDPRRADLQHIETAGKRAVDLTRQLLAFSRKQILQPRVLNLNNVIAVADKMLRRLIGEHVELVTVLPATLGLARLDPLQVEQVIVNLVANARDAMPAGGKITLETADVVLGEGASPGESEPPPGRYVMLAVSDTGPGMDEATHGRIFEPFFTTKEQGKGTGLGLSTVLGIVRQSEGHVRVESCPDGGTTFRIHFPCVQRDVRGERKSLGDAPPATLRGSETILLVEDEEQVRVLARTILRRFGYRVLEAQGGSDALLLGEQHTGPIHLLLTDVVMPRMSGRQLAERLLAIRPDMKVLYMSGHTDDAIVRHGIVEAAIAFLQKPITPENLTAKIREVLSAAAVHPE